MDIIQYLLSLIQYLYQQNCWLINFICRYIPLKQWVFDDSHSLNTRSSRSMRSRLLLTSARAGLTRSLSPISKNATERRSGL